MEKLVRAICPNLPSNKSVKATRDVNGWYKINPTTNTMYVPPASAVRYNMVELNKLCEALQGFEVYQPEKPEYDWEHLHIYEASTPPEILSALRETQAIAHAYGGMVACDIETRGLEWKDNILLSIGFAVSEDTVFCFRNIPIPGSKFEGQLSSEIHQRLQELFNDSDLTFIWHNGKFDTGKLKYLCNLNARIDEDTMLEHYVRINEKKGTHGLKELGQLYLQAPAWDDQLDQIKKDYCKQNKVKLADFQYDMIPTEILIPYMGRDCIATYRLHQVFQKLVQPSTEFIYRQLIIAANVYRQVELNGFRLDLEYLEDLEYDLEQEISKGQKALDAAAAQIWNPLLYQRMTGAKSAPATFSFKSPKQLKWMLQEILGYPVASTDAHTIEQLVAEVDAGVITDPVAVDFITNIGKVRQYSKYMDTYVCGLRSVVCPDSRVRGTFNLHGTETGRLSSTNPNMQNIPRNKKIKNLLCAAPGYKLLQLDYSQAELRVLAMLSRDPWLIQTYKDGKDLHAAVAEEMFGPDFTKEQRTMAKTINFGIAYGRGASSISEAFGKSRAESQEIINKWFKPMPKVKEFIDAQRRKPLKGEPCVTLLGRERHFVITDEEMNHIQNEYINTPIQSVASDMTMLSLCSIHQNLLDHGVDAKIVSTVHDSIILEVVDDKRVIDKVAQLCLDTMANTPKRFIPDCPVPFKADAEVGYSYGAMEEWIPDEVDNS